MVWIHFEKYCIILCACMGCSFPVAKDNEVILFLNCPIIVW